MNASTGLAGMVRSIGASDAAIDTLAARAQASQSIMPNRTAVREDHPDSDTLAKPAGPLGGSDAAHDAFAARSQTGQKAQLGWSAASSAPP